MRFSIIASASHAVFVIVYTDDGLDIGLAEAAGITDLSKAPKGLCSSSI